MQNTKHTPGEWKRNTSAHQTTFVVGDDRTPIFTIIHNERTVRERDYNDTLIASAPELLEALELAYAALQASEPLFTEWPENKVIANAIRKAKGGQL